MRISDWSSDVCSSDLLRLFRGAAKTLINESYSAAQPRVPSKRPAVTATLTAKTPAATPVETYTPKQWTARRSREKPAVTAWATAQGFTAKPGQVLVLPDNRSGRAARVLAGIGETRSEEHTSELQSLMRISYAVFCLTTK